MVKAGCEFKGPETTDPAPRRLDADQACGAARPADRSASVRSKRAETEPRSSRDRRTAGRNAGPIVRMPWIHRRSDRRVIIGIGALGHLKLAKQNRSGLSQARHYG